MRALIEERDGRQRETDQRLDRNNLPSHEQTPTTQRSRAAGPVSNWNISDCQLMMLRKVLYLLRITQKGGKSGMMEDYKSGFVPRNKTDR